MKKKELFILIGLWLLAICFTVLVATVSVQEVGPNNSLVGFSSLNAFMHSILGESSLFDKLSDVLLLLSLGIVGIYGLVGLVQLIKRKNIFKVDLPILGLGVTYGVMIVIYVLFELLHINYRPMLVDGVLEASYPSSHTLFALVVCGTSYVINNLVFKLKSNKYLNYGLYGVMILMVVTRLLSGMHWFTDIVGSIFISSAIAYSYYYFIKIKKLD